MSGMGGAARPHYTARCGVLQGRRIWSNFLINSAGGDPEARPMAGPEGTAPIPRWATATPRPKRPPSRPQVDERSRPAAVCAMHGRGSFQR